MANTIDKRHNLVLSQLIEHEPNPIEAIKRGSLGIYPNSRFFNSLNNNFFRT